MGPAAPRGCLQGEDAESLWVALNWLKNCTALLPLWLGTSSFGVAPSLAHHLKQQFSTMPSPKPQFQSSWHSKKAWIRSGSQSLLEWRLIMSKRVTGRQWKEELPSRTSSTTLAASPTPPCLPWKVGPSCPPPCSSAKTQEDNSCKKYPALFLGLNNSKICY